MTAVKLLLVPIAFGLGVVVVCVIFMWAVYQYSRLKYWLWSRRNGLSDEQAAALLRDRVEDIEWRNRIVGDLYSVVKKETQEIEFWISESEDSWELEQKFGAWQHKRALPFRSQTHDINLLLRDVTLDKGLHLHLKPSRIEEESRKLRRARQECAVNESNETADLYVLLDRIKKTQRCYLVREDLLEEFRAKFPSGDFRRVALAATKVPANVPGGYHLHFEVFGRT